MKTYFICFILMLGSVPVWAAKTCHLSLQNIRLENSGRNINYDMFETGSFALIQNHFIDIKNNSPDGVCDTVLLIKPRQNAFRGAQRSQQLEYQILAGRNSGAIYENGLAIVIRDLKPKEIRTVGYQLKFASQQYVSHGQYRNLFQYSAVEYPLNRTNIYDETNAEFQVQVNKTARVSLWGTNDRHQYQVDFGELETGETRQLTPQLLVQSTADYSIEFQSQNRGHLRHDSGDSQWDVDYGFFVNNRSVPLQTGRSLLSFRQPASAVGDRYSMMFRIGNVRNKPAGQYEDVITITVTPSLVH
ncbi:hypothetical protein KDD30_17840 (plasmid) [Photobacterium sp. GJ3]|uniref:hypothetical protein n=1 Tax=Photobacterium sp. GJ3 TaxID=2829502 RepID=UPI001B8A9032|nr:hypothetical protein [Photobacterium sp. GJ3]QUJ70014.1 hypothetical protein KDD30_17840 [Photobacterium sp. GJ3]